MAAGVSAPWGRDSCPADTAPISHADGTRHGDASATEDDCYAKRNADRHSDEYPDTRENPHIDA